MSDSGNVGGFSESRFSAGLGSPAYVPLRLRRLQRSAERMKNQRDLDLRYAFGAINLEEWRKETDRLGNC